MSGTSRLLISLSLRGGIYFLVWIMFDLYGDDYDRGILCPIGLESVFRIVHMFKLVFKFKLVYSFKIVSWCDETYPE
jgi:hypothetical protein